MRPVAPDKVCGSGAEHADAKWLIGTLCSDSEALVPGIEPGEWTPRELRHSFVSLRSASGISLEDISRLVGHSGTQVTELVYRHELRPVIQTGAVTMDALFTGDGT